MSGTHGDLFSEIGKIVLAAHTGEPIDLKAKSEDLASRYWNLGLPADTLAKVLARSLGAIGVSMALVSHQNGGARSSAAAGANGKGAANGNGHRDIAPLIRGDGEPIKLNDALHDVEHVNGNAIEGPTKSPAVLFPSGVRLAVLS
jgi:hypothetical protein